MSDTTHGVSMPEYAAALGAITTHNIDINLIFKALNIESQQWTEVCNTYQFSAMTDMATYMQYFGNPSLCPKFSNLVQPLPSSTNTSTANSFFDQLMSGFSDFDIESDDDVTEDDTPVADDKKHLLAFGSIILYQHPVETLQIYSSKNDLKEMLGNAWEITNTQEAIETLDWLKEAGHRDEEVDTQDEEVKIAIQEYSKALSPQIKLNIDAAGNFQDVDAWDIERIASVARYCYAAGYINEETCFKYLEIAKNMATERYKNWFEYASSFMTGRAAFWGNNPIAFASAIKESLQDKNSVWNTTCIDWKK